MAEYLTEMAYTRWLKQYLVNIKFYFDTLEDARLYLAQYVTHPEAEEVAELIGEIEHRLESAIPRNFNVGANPLIGSQKFLENSKVLANLLLKFFKKDYRFIGIYQKEKERIMDIHREFKFKEKLDEVKELLETIERETTVERQTVAESAKAG